MGNANGSEEGVENGGGGDNGVRGGANNAAPTVRVVSADSMASSPPHNHRQSLTPLLISSQDPAVPLHRNDGSSFSPLQKNESQRYNDDPPEQGIPTIITWSFGGKNVTVEGSWDNWKTRKLLQRSGKDHSILLVLPLGIFRYKFMVDGEERYIPDLPSETDEKGHIYNLLDVQDYVPDNLDSVAQFETPPSPDSSYSQVLPRDEEFTKDPVLVPLQLQSSVLDSEIQEENTLSKPQHVVLNHLFVESGRPSESIVALGLTHRFQTKYITVVLYKPFKRNRSSKELLKVLEQESEFPCIRGISAHWKVLKHL